MNPIPLSEIRTELSGRTFKELFEIIMRLAKYNKENKELLSYLLIDSLNESEYIRSAKEAVSYEFMEAGSNSLHLTKKSIRKILKDTNKFIKYSGQKQTEVELLIHFCYEFVSFGFLIMRNPTLNNIFERQVIKIRKVLATLHEDLQYDYNEAILSLESVLKESKNY